ncbi:MAG: hypothetical protein HOM11_18005 [Methylococcales bacterium]|jgi:hypothetical protein|nr:hypothetical protein [Methylococcales bacterium]MBT7442419.1 hypothetical protein [Methylococcales bacterium]
MATPNFQQIKQDSLNKLPDYNIASQPDLSNITIQQLNISGTPNKNGVINQLSTTASHASNTINTTQKIIQDLATPLQKVNFINNSLTLLKAGNNIYEASNADQSGQVLANELAQHAISKTTAAAVQVSIRGVAAVIGASDSPVPGPADLAAQTAAGHIISDVMSKKLGNYLLDSENPNKFGSLTRDNSGRWSKHLTTNWEVQSGSNPTIGPVSRTQVIDQNSSTHDWLEQQRYAKINLEKVTKDERGNRVFQFDDSIVTINSADDSRTQFSKNGQVIRQEQDTLFVLSKHKGTLNETPIKENTLDWTKNRVVNTKTILNEPNANKQQTYQYYLHRQKKAQAHTANINAKYGKDSFFGQSQKNRLDAFQKTLNTITDESPRLLTINSNRLKQQAPTQQNEHPTDFIHTIKQHPKALELKAQEMMSVNYPKEFNAVTEHKYGLPVEHAKANTTYTGTILGRDGYDTTPIDPKSPETQYFTLLKTKQSIILLPEDSALNENQNEPMTIHVDSAHTPQASTPKGAQMELSR